MPAPHAAFHSIRPDEVAECWDGIPDGLYRSLWKSMKFVPPYEGETPPEPDLLCLAKVWDYFTEAEQFTLNYIACEQEEKIAEAIARLDAKYGEIK